MVSLTQIILVRTTKFKGWKRIAAFDFAEEMSLRVNCQVIFGDSLGKFSL